MLSHAGFTGNFQCELRNMRTQAFGLVQSSVDVPYVRDRIKAADLHGDGLKNVAFEVVVRLSSMVGNESLDRLEAIGRWRGRDDVLLQQR